MFSIKWNNGFSNFRTTYYGTFKRLGYCNAAYYQSEEHNEYENMKFKIYGFVSYSTPICKVVYYHNLNTNKDGYSVYVNRESFRCSSSTIHQLVRFLRIAMGNLFTYQDIKWYDEHAAATPIDIASHIPITLWWVTESTMRSSMAGFDNAWYVTERG